MLRSQPRAKPFQLNDIVSASSRVAWGDYDNDGDDDIMTNGPLLYANNGDGTFEDLTDILYLLLIIQAVAFGEITTTTVA